MREKLLLSVVILLVFLLCHVAKQRLDKQDSVEFSSSTLSNDKNTDDPQRIVSMAPSVTEILFALGLGEKVVGASRYCNYPAETVDLPRIGGVLDPNIEAIVALKPDLAVLLHGNRAICPALHRLGIRTLTIDHKTIQGVLESITTVGYVCGNREAAETMTNNIASRIDSIRRKTAGLECPRVLLCVTRNLGVGRLEDVYVAGDDAYFDEMIETAGGDNLFGNVAVRYPVVSPESIIKADPQIIIDIVPSMSIQKAELAKADWQQLRDTEAATKEKVYCLAADYVSVPGPRFILLLEELAKLIHPEVDWSGE